MFKKIFVYDKIALREHIEKKTDVRVSSLRGMQF